MANQGRLLKVMFFLMVAMTSGTLLLLALEGKPINPVAFSLSSQSRSVSLQSVLGTESGITPGKWKTIEIFYQANNGNLGRSGLSGEFRDGYHFVISDGYIGDDGQIYVSPRWEMQYDCLDSGKISRYPGKIKICVISQTGRLSGTPWQGTQLEDLLASLHRHCQIEKRDIKIVK